MIRVAKMLAACLVVPFIAGMAGAAHAQLATQTQDRLDTRPVLPREGAEVQGAAPGLMPTINVQGKISAVRVEGSSLPQEKIRAATRRFIGEASDAGRLRALADAVAAQFPRSRIAGYSVLVPEQDSRDVEVRIVALETYVDEVVIAGPGASKAGLTRAYAAEMSKERPLRRPTLERYLLLMN